MSGADGSGVRDCIGLWLRGGRGMKGEHPRDGSEGTRLQGLEDRQLGATDGGLVEASGAAQPA